MFLYFVMKDDNFASPTQRVRAVGMPLEGGGFLSPRTKETGLFREPEETDGADEQEGV